VNAMTSSEPQAYLNGQWLPASQASIGLADAGFVLGATVSEQLRTFGGKLFRLEAHLDRLERSLAITGVTPGITRQEFQQIAMQLAETLGLKAHDVHPQVADTDSVGYTDVTGGSRVTFATGLAAYHAGLDIRQQMQARAAILWECKSDQVTWEDGLFRHGDKTFTFRELAGKLNQTGGPVVGRASVDPEGPTNGFGTHIVDVEVDPDTGKVTILRYTAVQDAGKAIHPSYVEGQMQGGSVQGIGWALNEEYFYDDQGKMRNASYLDYRMPTALDLPMIDTIIVEVPNPAHPFGVRGVGETPIVAPPAAVAAAIHNAIGARLFELPMAPHRVWAAIRDKATAG